MTDTIELMDEHGNRHQVPRAEYASQMMAFAKQNWDNLDALRNMQVQLVQAGLPNEAYELATRTCELSNEHVNDLYWRAASLAETGKLDEAASQFAELQEDAAYPTDQARAAVGLSRVRAKQGKAAEAEELLNWAVGVDPQNPGPLHSLYNYWNEKQQPEKALSTIREIAAQQPRNPAPYRVMAHIALQNQKPDEVRENAWRAVECAASPEQEDETVAEMSWMLGSAGLPEEIIKLVEPRRLKIRNAQSYLNLVQAYTDTGRKEDARTLLKQLIEGAPPEMRAMLEQRLNQIA